MHIYLEVLELLLYSRVSYLWDPSIMGWFGWVLVWVCFFLNSEDLPYGFSIIFHSWFKIIELLYKL